MFNFSRENTGEVAKWWRNVDKQILFLFIFLFLLGLFFSFSSTSSIIAEKMNKDPENRLLSRGPVFRMDGEMIRDYVLAASGLVVRKVGGPSVKPYQPAGVWKTVAMPSSNPRIY